jgi:hypothetical protein
MRKNECHVPVNKTCILPNNDHVNITHNTFIHIHIGLAWNLFSLAESIGNFI